MNPGFFFQQSNSSSQLPLNNAPEVRSQLNAPNFSGFSASPDKPFLPMFGVPVPSAPLNGEYNVSNRKRRSQAPTVEMDMDARQRKVFITEERMVRGMSRLNLDQGPDILQDLSTTNDEFCDDDASTNDLGKFDAAEFDRNDVSPSKFVLSETLKQFVDREQPILPAGVVKRISQTAPINSSRELILWQPPGQQIRDVIRKSLMKANEEENEQVEMSERESSSNSLPDLLLSGDGIRRTGVVTTPASDPVWTFEQMET